MKVEVLISNNLLEKTNIKIMSNTDLSTKNSENNTSWKFLKNLQQVRFIQVKYIIFFLILGSTIQSNLFE